MRQTDIAEAPREYHAHVYYDVHNRSRATELREMVENKFDVKLSPLSDEPQGPHLSAQYQITFAQEQFSGLVTYLMMNRMGLSLMIHPQSGRPRDDHTLHAIWMGDVLPVNVEFFRENDRES